MLKGLLNKAYGQFGQKSLKPRSNLELAEIIEQQRVEIESLRETLIDWARQRDEFLIKASASDFGEIIEHLYVNVLDIDGLFGFIDQIKSVVDKAPIRRDGPYIEEHDYTMDAAGTVEGLQRSIEAYQANKRRATEPHIWVNDGSDFCVVCEHRQTHPNHNETGSIRDSERVVNND